MRFERAFIPIGGAWSSPFARWQGAFSDISSYDLAVQVTRRALDMRGIDPAEIEHIVLGWTVPQYGAFASAPGIAKRIGAAPGATGPLISQACATGVYAITAAALEVETGEDATHIALLTDRTSNGPHVVYPAPSAQGGTLVHENWVMDNFRRDPWEGHAMLQTSENVIRDAGVTREELDDVTFLRYEQYRAALADDRAFQRRYMVPVEVPVRRGDPDVVESDVGVHDTSREALAKLKPVAEDGLTTFGGQTHPADGTAGVLVTTEQRARALGTEAGVVRILATGVARVANAEMPKAPVPAAQRALEHAGLTFADIDAVTTHNPFTVNDIWFARHSGIPVEDFNLFGCSLVFGHPHAATGARLVTELIETLRLRGGGVGMFAGCAAGDSGAAIIVRVDD